ncbi:MAG: tetratricopeptide repeat protein [Gammaproteobacteria bacterium]|nr:tetratricopeptide repeat protein [Gammaproteobacteria bacterium]MDE2023733.1 tetratricopeptide repeat protein [Gammaproteobacteria bacterium]MDE2139516.1 tetratricopeptide repeat protein [Gammaproteobacteria bacterium]MDE2274029.1 tetratricopeptide repeat protein [Gammaproteobacteria bacterium]
MPRWLFVILLGLGALLLCASSHAADQAETAYARGVTAFRVGDYADALDDFLRARAAGYRSVQLNYSLGAVYYRLGRYPEAKLEFESLLPVPRLAALVRYNLGLIAAAQGERNAALREYRAAYAEASQPDIKRLAAAEIARLTPSTLSPPRWFGYANLSAGYDDNVALAPQFGVTSPSRQGSSLTTVLAGGAAQLAGTYANGLELSGSYYGTDYSRLSQYDETLLNLGAQYRFSSDPWSGQLGMSGSDVTLGGAAFETLGTLQFAVRKQLAAGNRLVAGYAYQHVSGNQSFDYLSGWQQQVFLQDEIAAPSYKAIFGYQHEINRRKDLTLGTEFLSASPTRNRLYAQLALHATDRLSWEFGLSYEKSVYGKPDVLVSGNATTTIGRSDALYIGKLGADYKLSKRWILTVEYRDLKNSSNVDIYSYQSNRYALSVEYLLF